MSAFLGPIHTWLYGKILFQNEMVDRIESYAKEQNWLPKNFDADRYGQLEQGNLEDICDSMNIHGWLQERVSLVENRLAYVVTQSTIDSPEHILEILWMVYKYGREQGLQEKLEISEVHEFLESKLLNGMPCDHVNQIVEQDEEHIVWEQVTDIHKKYWDEVDGKIEIYYEIRKYLIEGLLVGSGHTLNVRDNVYEIR